MADRFPLILNTSANQIQEIASGDNLDLTGVGINNVGVITSGNVTIGAATTDLVVTGDARITGILTVGTSSLKLDGPNNLVNVGTALTLGHTQGLQFHTQNLHSEGFEINQINLSGIATFNEARFGNSKRLKFGEDIDLQIYHFPAGSGTNYISAANNTGVVVSSQNVSLMNQNHSAYFFKGEAAGSIVYHNNTARVTTTGTGINVTGNNVVSGNVTAVDGTFSGNVSIGGTLTYEDVTNIDSVGIITARNGLTVSSGTATFQGAIDANGDLDVDGHTNLDNVNVVGVLTVTGAVNASHSTFGNLNTTGITIENTNASIIFNDTNNNPDYWAKADSGIFEIVQYNNGGSNIQAVKINTDGHIDIATNVDFAAGIDVTGTAVATGADINGDLDVDGHTNLDNVNIVGVVTVSQQVHTFAQQITGDNTDSLDFTNNTSNDNRGIAFNARTALSADQSDGYLRLNNQSEFSNGVFTPGVFRADGGINWNGNQTIVNNSGQINGSRILTGTIPVAQIGTGTKNTSTFYRGDGTFATVTAPAITTINNASNNRIVTSEGGTTVNSEGNLTFDGTHLAVGAINPGDHYYSRGIACHAAGTGSVLHLTDSSSGSGQDNGFDVISHGGNAYLWQRETSDMIIGVGGNTKWSINNDGDFWPNGNGNQDIGKTSNRVQNLYTSDLHLSNEAKGGNSIDNTWGDYTIQEGESDLFLINNRSGKKYKFNLTEVL